MIKVLTKGMCHFPPPCPLTTKAIAMLKEIRYRHTAYVKENSHNGANRIDLNASGMSLVVRKIRGVACSPAIAWPTVNPRATTSSPIHSHSKLEEHAGYLTRRSCPRPLRDVDRCNESSIPRTAPGDRLAHTRGDPEEHKRRLGPRPSRPRQRQDVFIAVRR